MQKDLSRLPALDGLRGLAILLVLVWHFVPGQLTGAFPSASWQSISIKYLAKTWSGVDLFFVLSGFLIFRLLFHHGASSPYLKTFYVRRACRILPLYLLFLTGFYFFRAAIVDKTAFSWLLDTPMPLWSYLALIQNWFMGFRGNVGCGWLGVTWSLAVEEQFYLLAPILFLIIKKFRPLILVFWVVPVLLRHSHQFGFHAFPNTFLRLDSFMLGAFASVFQIPKKANQALLFGLGALLLGSLIKPDSNLFFWWDDNLFCGLFYMSLLNYVVHYPGPISSLLSSKALIFLGRLSFGLYLSHQVVSGLLHGYFFSTSPSLASPEHIAVTVLSLVLSLLLSYALNLLIEQPLIKWGHKQTLPTNRIQLVQEPVI
jgi:peptidoglycan/LPS O-acetylase OafA/YrhL